MYSLALQRQLKMVCWDLLHSRGENQARTGQCGAEMGLRVPYGMNRGSHLPVRECRHMLGHVGPVPDCASPPLDERGEIRARPSISSLSLCICRTRRTVSAFSGHRGATTASMWPAGYLGPPHRPFGRSGRLSGHFPRIRAGPERRGRRGGGVGHARRPAGGHIRLGNGGAWPGEGDPLHGSAVVRITAQQQSGGGAHGHAPARQCSRPGGQAAVTGPRPARDVPKAKTQLYGLAKYHVFFQAILYALTQRDALVLGILIDPAAQIGRIDGGLPDGHPLQDGNKCAGFPLVRLFGFSALSIASGACGHGPPTESPALSRRENGALIPHIREWLTQAHARVLMEPCAGAACWHVVLQDGAPLAEPIRHFTPTRKLVHALEQSGVRCVAEHALRTLVLNRTNRAGILAPGASSMPAGENGKGLVAR